MDGDQRVGVRGNTGLNAGLSLGRFTARHPRKGAGHGAFTNLLRDPALTASGAVFGASAPPCPRPRPPSQARRSPVPLRQLRESTQVSSYRRNKVLFWQVDFQTAINSSFPLSKLSRSSDSLGCQPVSLQPSVRRPGPPLLAVPGTAGGRLGGGRAVPRAPSLAQAERPGSPRLSRAWKDACASGNTEPRRLS